MSIQTRQIVVQQGSQCSELTQRRLQRLWQGWRHGPEGVAKVRYSHMAHQCFYRIEVEGEVDTAWCHHSGNSAIMVEQREGREAVTVLLGLTSDQAALSRVLSGLHEQHIPVLSVDAIDTGDAASRAS